MLPTASGRWILVYEGANTVSAQTFHPLQNLFYGVNFAAGRVLLVDARQAQAPFIAPSLLASGSELIGKIIAHVEASLPELSGLAELAAQFCMSERTFTRHVRAATGRSTQDLLQSVRLGRARVLLATSRMTVEQIAEQVGYSDATALRRMMRKLVGATPRQFRPTAYGTYS